MAALVMAACNSGHKSTPNNGYTDADEADALPYGVTDTIDGRKVTADCAVSAAALQDLRIEAEQLASPSMLMNFRARYEGRLAEALSGTENLTDDEMRIINLQKDSLETTLRKQCKELAVPAEGVIQNLQNCIGMVGRAKNRQQLIMLIESRRGVLQQLDDIHLCVEEHSTRISEVKRLAKQLKNDLERKKSQFGIEE